MSAREVSLLTGFLGAGKTTLLNAIIKAKPNTCFAIIENEIGEESIDADLILKGEDDIIEMNNGCLCCSLNDNLYDILSNLWQRREEWDELIIEATGIADPANIALSFLTETRVQQAFQLKRVIVVVDAELIEDQLKDTEEAIKQIAFADIILLNKTEKVDKGYISELRSILKAINPFSEILIGTMNNLQIEGLFAHERTTDFNTNPKAMLTPKGMMNLVPVAQQADTGLIAAPLSSGSSHKRHIHSDIETIVIRFAESMDIEKLEHQMLIFLYVQAINVYRVKGIIYSAEHDCKVILQTVGKGMAISMGKPWLPEERRETKIVIIGKKLHIYGFENMLRKCLSTPLCS